MLVNYVHHCLTWMNNITAYANLFYCLNLIKSSHASIARRVNINFNSHVFLHDQSIFIVPAVIKFNVHTISGKNKTVRLAQLI